MEAVVRKWGNSLGIRIPNLIVRELRLKDGIPVSIKDKNGEIVIKPQKKETLSEMLNKISSDNIHAEVESGGPMGNEVW
jgi:antitoxin MazE